MRAPRPYALPRQALPHPYVCGTAPCLQGASRLLTANAGAGAAVERLAQADKPATADSKPAVVRVSADSEAKPRPATVASEPARAVQTAAADANGGSTRRVSGPASAMAMTGSFVVERVFNVPGMGQHFVNGVLKELHLISDTTKEKAVGA